MRRHPRSWPRERWPHELQVAFLYVTLRASIHRHRSEQPIPPESRRQSLSALEAADPHRFQATKWPASPSRWFIPYSRLQTAACRLCCRLQTVVDLRVGLVWHTSGTNGGVSSIYRLREFFLSEDVTNNDQEPKNLENLL